MTVAAHSAVSSVRHPGERGEPASRGDHAWIPAFAGMTDGKDRVVLAIIGAR